MSKYELKHAKRYAMESTKLFIMNFYKEKYPHFFENAIIETRPATSDDYYIPPSLARNCIVVTKTAFDEIGCKRLACFPLKENGKPCDGGPLWVEIGNDYHLACQRSCAEQTDNIDTMWKKGECILLNPLKKIFAINPEEVFNRPARGHLHSGLNVENGTLKVNRRYCMVYGLNYKDEDCIRTTGQKIAEAIVGKTIHRSIATRNLKPRIRLPTPEIPSYLNYEVPSRKTKRHIYDEAPEALDVIKDIAVEFAKDELVDMSAKSIRYILKKQIPRLLSKVTIKDIGTKIAMKELIKKTVKSASTKILIALGSSLTVALALYEIFSIIVDILDAIDPLDFNKVLTKSDLDKFNESLDFMYYEETRKHGVFTPEDLWNRGILLIDDQSNIVEHMAEKINEYLAALRDAKDDINWTKFQPIISKDWSQWRQGAVIFFVICIMFMYSNWIHICTVILFFVLIYFKNYTSLI